MAPPGFPVGSSVGPIQTCHRKELGRRVLHMQEPKVQFSLCSPVPRSAGSKPDPILALTSTDSFSGCSPHLSPEIQCSDMGMSMLRACEASHPACYLFIARCHTVHLSRELAEVATLGRAAGPTRATQLYAQGRRNKPAKPVSHKRSPRPPIQESS